MCPLFHYAAYAAARAPVETKKKQYISSLHTYAGCAAARAPVEPKKKQDISFFKSYLVFISLGLILPSVLARSLYMYFMCPLFHYAAYAVARAPVEMKKKQDLSFFHTYAAYTAARAPVEAKKKQDLSFFHTYAVFLSLIF
jgi:hypothetical protein